MRILVLENDPMLGQKLKEGLEKSHYAVDLVANGADGYLLGRTIAYDLILLEVTLPDLDGFQICQRLRAHKQEMPICFLSALDQLEFRVKGLNAGADDYLIKPFSFRELEARVRALLRRRSEVKTPVMRFFDMTLDTTTREVRRGTRHITVGPKGFALLECLLRSPSSVLSRADLVEHVWDLDVSHHSNVVDAHISYLRKQLCAEGEVDMIQTIRDVGYRLKEPSA